VAGKSQLMVKSSSGMVSSGRDDNDYDEVRDSINKPLEEISLYWLYSLIYKLTLTKSL